MAITINGSANTIAGVSAGGINDNVVDNGTMADDAIGVAELSATGTASSSTYLRGDNAWATPAGGDTNTPAFQVYKSGNCAVNHATHGEIVIDTELWDSASAYDTSTGRFTPQTAGTYFIYFECYPAMGGDQVNFIGQLRKNGSDAYNTGYAITQFVAKTGEAAPAHYCSGIFSLNGSSDYVSPWTYIWNYTSSSNNRNTQNNFFGGFRLGAAF